MLQVHDFDGHDTTLGVSSVFSTLFFLFKLSKASRVAATWLHLPLIPAEQPDLLLITWPDEPIIRKQA